MAPSEEAGHRKTARNCAPSTRMYADKRKANANRGIMRNARKNQGMGTRDAERIPRTGKPATDFSED